MKNHLPHSPLAMEPEAPLLEIASGNFANMSAPILIAAATLEQFEEFVFSNGLCCSECRRFRGYKRFEQCAPNKVLILLPFFYDDPETDDAVEDWVDAERYTCHMDEPIPLIVRSVYFWMFVLIVIAATWAAAIWWMGR